MKNKLLVLIAAILFFISNPNPIFHNGLGFLGFFIYLPILLCVHRANLKNIFIDGGLYGALSYGIYAYWLFAYEPLGLLIVCVCYFFIMMTVFAGLKVIDVLFEKNGWIVQLFFICGYEYLKTLGFFGMGYGVTAYTQWKFLQLIQISQIVGVFGLNLIVIFPSAFLYCLMIKDCVRGKNTYIVGSIWCILFLLSIFYGNQKIKHTHFDNYVKIAAIQNNEDPRKNGISEYTKNVRQLISLSDEALELNPDIDIIVWPETAVTPSIIYQYYSRKDARRFDLISYLLKYIDSKDAVFVIGNSHEVDTKKAFRDRYNSAFVFEPKANVIPPNPEIYSKIHLVPFSEDFPMKKYFPTLYEKFLNGEPQMWEKGTKYKVFTKKGLSFSTPICFEDTFSEGCRQMVLNGSRCFLNLSNDSWSKSIACQKQHLAMAVFRSVENRVPSVRSTSSGQTCVIDVNGKIIVEIPAFCCLYTSALVPIIDSCYKATLFTKFGDIAGIFEVLLTVVILIIQLIRTIIKKNE